MPSASVTVFLKDEQVHSWLKWHTFLFGPAIAIIDHASSPPHAAALSTAVAKLKLRGVRIVRFNGSFTDKHNEVTREMQRFKNKVDFVFALDADEYVLACAGDVRNATDQKRRVHSALSQLVERKNEKFKFWTRDACGGVPGEPGRGRSDERRDPLCSPTPSRACKYFVANIESPHCGSKTFFRAASFVSVDQGVHFGASAHAETIAYVPKKAEDALCLYHKQPASPLEKYTRAVRGAVAYGWFSTNESDGTLHQRRLCSSRPYDGNHYCRIVRNWLSQRGPGNQIRHASPTQRGKLRYASEPFHHF